MQFRSHYRKATIQRELQKNNKYRILLNYIMCCTGQPTCFPIKLAVLYNTLICSALLQVVKTVDSLATETVEGLALALESVHDVHSSDSFAAGVLSVGDSITDDRLQENL